jgi:putative phosphoribosyl transferase
MKGRPVDFKGIHELADLKNKIGVFKDREHAGALLGDMLSGCLFDRGIVLAIPSGGVPVGRVVADRLGFPLDVAVVSKITLPWNTEVGYGAVAFDGTCTMNRVLISHLPLSESQIEEGIRKTSSKVDRRSRMFRKDRPFPDLKGQSVILVDDGLASGFTMRTAVKALRKANAQTLVVAVPTAHARAIEEVADLAEGVFCANIREGGMFAVADAYEYWYDISEDEVMELLKDD